MGLKKQQFDWISAGTINKTEACSLTRSLKVKNKDVCKCKQTSRILHIVYVLDTLAAVHLSLDTSHIVISRQTFNNELFITSIFKA